MDNKKSLIHYSREGYNGDYTYTSVCGEQVRTHQKDIDTTIYPELANCKKCIATKQYKEDTRMTPPGVKVRIYIESDILQASEFRDAQRTVAQIAKKNKEKCVPRIFSKVLAHAWHDLEGTWAAVKAADEVYATSSLLPLSGGTYMGAPAIFNGMCDRAIKENITGKSVIILNNMKYISCNYIDIPMMKKAFTDNLLVMYNDEYELVNVDVSSIKK